MLVNFQLSARTLTSLPKFSLKTVNSNCLTEDQIGSFRCLLIGDRNAKEAAIILEETDGSGLAVETQFEGKINLLFQLC